jgi:hypothetical protein
MENQWGYMNPETYVTKPKQVKGLGMLETKSSESEESDSDEQKAQNETYRRKAMLLQAEKYPCYI